MKKINEIELKAGMNLSYGIKFHLQDGTRKKIVNVQQTFESDSDKSAFLDRVGNWKELFVGWDNKLDEKILADLGTEIAQEHLIAIDGKAISVFDFAKYVIHN